jgi:hypothetical protein
MFLMQTQWTESGTSNGPTSSSSNSKVDKSWEWNRENLNQFMELLGKHNPSLDKNNINLVQSTNITLAHALQFPELNKYLTYLNPDEKSIYPAHLLSKRPLNKRGI